MPSYPILKNTQSETISPEQRAMNHPQLTIIIVKHSIRSFFKFNGIGKDAALRERMFYLEIAF
jgi:hypothetical protein